MPITNDLWIRDNQAVTLPDELMDSDGFLWTDLANNEVAQQKLGLVKAPDYPIYDASVQAPEWQNGAWVLVDLPTPPVVTPARAELPKSTVIKRLIALGKADVVFTALEQNKGNYALWFSPDWPNVYVDDADALALFQATGLTSDEIGQVMNPDPTYVIPTAG